MEKLVLKVDNIPSFGPDYSLCIGTFDAVHLGHQELINLAKTLTKKVIVLIVYTKDEQLKNHADLGYLTSLDDRIDIFNNLGVDKVLLLELTKEVKSLSPDEFVKTIIEGLGVSNVVVGNEFRFGFKGSGNINTLKNYANSFITHGVDPVLISKKTKISTTKIKYFLSIGRLDKANKYLSRPYIISGKVATGHKLGNSIGYPTANIELANTYFVPKKGVYFAAVYLDNKKYYAMVSIGIHPTVNKLKKPILEAYIFNFSKMIYDKHISVALLNYLRPELKFNKLEDMIKQIKNDEQTSLKIIEDLKIRENENGK